MGPSLPSTPVESAFLESASSAASVIGQQEPEILRLYQNLFQLAARTSPELRIARARKEQKSAERYSAWARRLSPNVSGEISQVHEYDKDEGKSKNTTDSEAEFEDTSDGDEYSDWALNLSLPLYQRSVSLNLQDAALDKQLADNQLAIATGELDVRLRELLGTYLAASYRLLNLKNSVAIAAEHVERINKGFELRDQTRLQLLQAQANLQELVARRDLSEQQRDTAFRALLDYSGLTSDEAIFGWLLSLTGEEQRTAGCISSLADLDGGYAHTRHFVDESGENGLRSAFADHSALHRQIELNHLLASSKAKRFTQDNWPELAVEGEYLRKKDTDFSDMRGEGQLALVFSVPLFTGGTLYSNAKAGSMARQAADTAKESELRKTLHSIENHRNLIQNLRKVYDTQLIQLQQQEEIVRLSLKSYDIKQTSMQDLLTAKNRLIDAKNALMESTATLGALYYRLAWELGHPLPQPSPPAAAERNQ